MIYEITVEVHEEKVDCNIPKLIKGLNDQCYNAYEDDRYDGKVHIIIKLHKARCFHHAMQVLSMYDGLPAEDLGAKHHFE